MTSVATRLNRLEKVSIEKQKRVVFVWLRPGETEEEGGARCGADGPGVVAVYIGWLAGNEYADGPVGEVSHLPGENDLLGPYFSAQGVASKPAALELGKQIAATVKELHAEGLTDRDLAQLLTEKESAQLPRQPAEEAEDEAPQGMGAEVVALVGGRRKRFNFNEG